MTSERSRSLLNGKRTKTMTLRGVSPLGSPLQAAKMFMLATIVWLFVDGDSGLSYPVAMLGALVAAAALWLWRRHFVKVRMSGKVLRVNDWFFTAPRCANPRVVLGRTDGRFQVTLDYGGRTVVLIGNVSEAQTRALCGELSSWLAGTRAGESPGAVVKA